MYINPGEHDPLSLLKALQELESYLIFFFRAFYLSTSGINIIN